MESRKRKFSTTFAEFEAFASIFAAELGEDGSDFLALRRPSGVEADEPVTFRALLKVVEVFDRVGKLDSIVGEEVKSDNAN